MLVNPARVWMAKARRGMTSKRLAELVGEQPRTVAKWSKPSGYALELSAAQVARLVFATGYPQGWFTGGDEEEDFAALDDIERSMFCCTGEK